MPSATPPALTPDEIDDLIYFTRVNELQDLKTTVAELAKKYNCKEADVVLSTIDPDSGNTLLHYCSANGHIDLLWAFLAQLGVDQQTLPATESSSDWSDFKPTIMRDEHIVNAQNKEGNTPLQWASYNGHLEVVKTLIAAGANMWIKNAAGHLAMFEAERAEKTDIVSFLLLAGGREVERAGVQQTTAGADDEIEAEDLTMSAGSLALNNGKDE